MMHIALGCHILVQTVNLLNLRQRCQCNNIADLCLSTGKHCRTVNSRNQVNLCSQRTNLINSSSIRPLVVLQNHLADGLLLILIYSLSQYSKPLFIVGKCLLELFCNCLNILFSLLLLVSEDCLLHLFRSDNLFHCCKHFLRNCTTGVSMLRLSNLLADLVHKSNDGLVDLMAFINSLDHLGLRNLVGTGLNHDHLLSG